MRDSNAETAQSLIVLFVVTAEVFTSRLSDKQAGLWVARRQTLITAIGDIPDRRYTSRVVLFEQSVVVLSALSVGGAKNSFTLRVHQNSALQGVAPLLAAVAMLLLF